MKNDNLDYSIIFPAYNEDSNLIPLIQRIVNTMGSLDVNYEIIAVNNGSEDSSSIIFDRLLEENKQLRVIELTRNFGYEAAIIAGIEHTSGAGVIIMDGDQQDPPEVIPEFIEKFNEGFDVVYGIRKKRPEGFLKSLKYKVFYKIWAVFSEMEIPKDAGNFCIIHKKVINLINSMPERNKFFRGLRAWSGFKSTGIVYERVSRISGRTKFSFLQLLNNGIFAITSFSTVPIRLFTIFGFFGIITSIILSIFLITTRILSLLGFDIWSYIVSGFTSNALLILFSISVNVFGIGLIGEYVSNIYWEVKNRPVYVIKNKIGWQ